MNTAQAMIVLLFNNHFELSNL
jgi:hypothetical protein